MAVGCGLGIGEATEEAEGEGSRQGVSSQKKVAPWRSWGRLWNRGRSGMSQLVAWTGPSPKFHNCMGQ